VSNSIILHLFCYTVTIESRPSTAANWLLLSDWLLWQCLLTMAPDCCYWDRWLTAAVMMPTDWLLLRCRLLCRCRLTAENTSQLVLLLPTGKVAILLTTGTKLDALRPTGKTRHNWCCCCLRGKLPSCLQQELSWMHWVRRGKHATTAVAAYGESCLPATNRN
jgi:hypothetical protein